MNEEINQTQMVAEGATQEVAQVAQSETQAVEERFDTEYVRKLRAEAAEYRKRLRELESKVKADEEAKMTEQEKLQKRLAELERKESEYQRALQERVLEYEVKLHATRLGIVDPNDAYRLLDLAQVEFDDEGKPVNVDKVLKELIAQKPWLVGNTHVSPTNPAKTKLSLDDIKRMSEEEINRRWDEVKRVLSGG